MVVDKFAKAAIKAVDQFAGMVFGGDLVKAKLVAFNKVDGTQSDQIGEFEFFLNPSTITVEREMKLEMEESAQGKAEAKYASTMPRCLKLPDLYFDTYDSRESVREKYIDGLEKLLEYDKKSHYAPVCSLIWGQFSQLTEKGPEYQFYVTKLSVDYTMFLPDATPVRAKVSMTLEEATTKKQELEKKGKESPDHAKLYTVKRGDTLQGIATAEYDDPREWRRIAKTNGITNPMDLRPGTKLLVPPILK